MAGLVLTDPLFSIWSSLIEDRAGLHYGPNDRDLLESKLAGRAAERGFDSLLDYYYFLRYDPTSSTELDTLVDALVVNETYFFREADQLRALCDTLVAPMALAGGHPRIWCAACSTGEEPLSLAMMLADRGLLSKVTLLASDISLRVMARIKEGAYGQRAMRALPPGVLGKWIETVEGYAKVAREIFHAVEWHRVNLTDEKEVAALGKFDAILCRNVLIYFSDETVLRVVRSLSNALHPGAPLLVGASESLLRFGTLLKCEERGGSFFYVKGSDV
jgi:chemotaxis protein methyltransferase CheR